MGRQHYANEAEHGISIVKCRHTKLNRSELDRYTEPVRLRVTLTRALPTQHSPLIISGTQTVMNEIVTVTQKKQIDTQTKNVISHENVTSS